MRTAAGRKRGSVDGASGSTDEEDDYDEDEEEDYIEPAQPWSFERLQLLLNLEQLEIGNGPNSSSGSPPGKGTPRRLRSSSDAKAADMHNRQTQALKMRKHRDSSKFSIAACEYAT